MPLIRDAHTPVDIDQIRELLLEYQAAIDVDLCFQDFAGELASLPGEYSPPAGRLLLAIDADSVLGCVALRPLQGSDCEMKRLYVRPAARGRGLGRLLTETLLHEARQVGYSRVVLDTLPSMTEARALYRAVGFTEIPPYCRNPIPGVSYLALPLRVR